MGDLRITNPTVTTQSLSQAKSDLATQGLRHGVAQNNPAKINKAAGDFESILIGQWLEQAEKSFGTIPGNDPDQENDSAHDQFQSIACQTLAQALSKTGGFGIASMISKQLLKTQLHPASEQGFNGNDLVNIRKTK